ncbi:hypothetical protein, partial [Streptomyces violascens]|uniref:hypothetical protein n=1 Tax=Streptomyces violascens TaxID=67381 RepID=UPI0036C697A4
MAEALDVLGLHLERPVPGPCRLQDQRAARRVLAGHRVQERGRGRVGRAADHRAPQRAFDEVGHDPVGEPPAEHARGPGEHRLPLSGRKLKQGGRHEGDHVHEFCVPGRLAEVGNLGWWGSGGRAPGAARLEHHQHRGLRLVRRSQCGQGGQQGFLRALLEMDGEPAVALAPG